MRINNGLNIRLPSTDHYYGRQKHVTSKMKMAKISVHRLGPTFWLYYPWSTLTHATSTIMCSLLSVTPTTVVGVRRSAASVCNSVCPHDKTKTAESTITKLATVIVHHDSSPTGNELILLLRLYGIYTGHCSIASVKAAIWSCFVSQVVF